MDLLSPKSLKLLKDLSKKERISEEEIDDQTKSRLSELVALEFATTGTIDHPKQDGIRLRVWDIEPPGVVYVQDHKDIEFRTTKGKWADRLFGFISGVSITLLAWWLSTYA